jgi:hypothetical protein
MDKQKISMAARPLVIGMVAALVFADLWAHLHSWEKTLDIGKIYC